jgi:serine/threonine protein phosphatase 1
MAVDDPFYPLRFLQYKEIFIGHTPVTRIGQTVPVQKANIWNVDTGAAFKGSALHHGCRQQEILAKRPIARFIPG